MGFVELLLGVVFVGAVGIGFAMIPDAKTRGEFSAVKWSFAIAFLAIPTAYIYWLHEVKPHIYLQFVFGIIALIILSVIAPKTLKWIASKEKRQSESAESIAEGIRRVLHQAPIISGSGNTATLTGDIKADIVHFGPQYSGITPIAGPSSESLDNTIVAEFANALMPTVVPKEGRINTIQLHPNGFSVGGRVGSPGGNWDWAGKEPMNAYKCTIKNFGKSAVSNIRLTLRAGYLENIKDGTGGRSGKLLSSNDYRIVIPVLKANADDEYALYVYNGTPNYVEIQLPVEATLQKVGEQQQFAVQLQVHTGGFPMHLFPT